MATAYRQLTRDHWSDFDDSAEASPADRPIRKRWHLGEAVSPPISLGRFDKFIGIKSDTIELPIASVDLDVERGAWRHLFTHLPLHRSPDQTLPTYRSVQSQVEELRVEAADDGEVFIEGSAQSLLRFCFDLAPLREPAIFRLQNGNLRAVWRDDAKDQIGIQFMPDGDLQFIILRDRGGRTLKTLGVEAAETIKAIVGVMRLNRLWFRG